MFRLIRLVDVLLGLVDLLVWSRKLGLILTKILQSCSSSSLETIDVVLYSFFPNILKLLLFITYYLFTLNSSA